MNDAEDNAGYWVPLADGADMARVHRTAWRATLANKDQVAPEYLKTWHDAKLGADYWFASDHVHPEQAALLLCGFNPFKDGARADAEQVDGDTKPEDFRRALLAFENAQSAAPAERRTLRDWIAVAKKMELRHHGWVNEYPVASQAMGAGAPADGKKWTPDRLDELAEYRKQHGTKAAAKRFGIHESRVRKLLPGKAAESTAHNPFPKRGP